MKKKLLPLAAFALMLGMVASCAPSDPTSAPDPTDPSTPTVVDPTTDPTEPDPTDPSTPTVVDPTDPSVPDPTDPSVPDPTDPSVPDPTDPTIPDDPFVAPESISLIGSIGDGDAWNTDYDLTSSDDGHTWTISDFLMKEGQKWKVRMNHNWGTAGVNNWGYSFLDDASKALFSGDNDIIVDTSAYYTVNFNYDEYVISVEKGDDYFEPADPTIYIEGGKVLSVAAGETITLPSITAKNYKNEDISELVEIEDLFESGTIDGNSFTAKTAGAHTLALYVEDDEARSAEDEIVINVTPAHEETFDVTGYNDVTNMTNYGVFKENFEKGKKSPLAAYGDTNNATHLSATDEAIKGNSLIIDFNKTSGSASNQIFLNAFNDVFHRGIQATYKVSFEYKLIVADNNFGDIYFGLSWDNFSGLNNTFVASGAVVGETYTYETSFPGTIVPETGNAWFSFFKYSGSTSDIIIAVDSFTVETIELAQVVPYTPSDAELYEGFTWDFENKGQTSSNGETVIIDNLGNETAKAAMQADEHFSKNALKLINADGHLFGGLTKNNMVAGKVLTLEVYYYAVNNGGFHLIMMSDNGNPTLKINNESLGNGMFKATFEDKISEGWNQLNIYGAGNPSFEIYVGYIYAKLSEPAPEPEPTNQTPNGYKVGDNWTTSSRQFGNQDKGAIGIFAFDDNSKAIENPKMGTAPSKLVVSGGNLNMEWYQANGTIENGNTYKIVVTYYVDSFAPTGDAAKFMLNFDNNVFLDVATNPSVGFYETEITWVADRTVDYFSFYFPDELTATIYIAKTYVELCEGNGLEAPKSANGHKLGTTWTTSSRQFGNQDKGAIGIFAFDDNSKAIENPKMGTAPSKLVVSGGNLNMEWYQANGTIENGNTYKIVVTYYVDSFAPTGDAAKFMLNFDNNVFLDVATNPSVGFYETEITWVADRTVDYFSFYFPDAVNATIYIASTSVTLTAIA